MAQPPTFRGSGNPGSLGPAIQVTDGRSAEGPILDTRRKVRFCSGLSGLGRFERRAIEQLHVFTMVHGGGEMNITEDLAAALHALVDASDAAERTPTDRQAARRAIEQAQLVVKLARRQGFGGRNQR